jgi:protein-tyrosine phosphatase
MTGPGRSSSSPWVQSTQGVPRDGVTQPFHPSMSPNTSERPSPNYFGMAVPTSNSQTSNPGLSPQKSWGASSHAQSLPSPKVQVYPKDSVSTGLVNMLKTEPEANRRRRESTFRETASNGDPHGKPSWLKSSSSHPSGNGLGVGASPVPLQGMILQLQSHCPVISRLTIDTKLTISRCYSHYIPLGLIRTLCRSPRVIAIEYHAI